MPGPYLAEYIATKHYMHSFTEVRLQILMDSSNQENDSNKVQYLQSLALEAEGTGVMIQEMNPGAVNTEMTKVMCQQILFLPVLNDLGLSIKRRLT